MKSTILYIKLIVVSHCLLFTSLKAQKINNIKIDWKIATMLPAKSNEETSLGFAGIISGEVDNYIIVAGGANFPTGMPWLGGKKVYYKDLYLFEKKDEALILKNFNISLPEPIAYSAVVNTSNGIIYAGGESELGLSKKVFAIQNSKMGIIITTLPDLPTAMANAAMVHINDKLYFAGGETSNGTSNQLLVLDLKNLKKGWSVLKNIPVSISHTVIAKQQSTSKDKLYLLGGRTKTATGISQFYKSVYAYDLSTNTWDQKNDLPYQLAAGTGIDINHNQILLFGGDMGIVFNKVEKLIKAIQIEKDTIKKQIFNNEKIQLQKTHPGFSNEVLLYHTETDTCIKLGEIPYPVPVTTNTFKSGAYIYITSGEIRAGIRAPYILSGKIF